MAISDLAIIIPVFNGWAQTERCLRSLEADSSSTDFTVVVVDHGSTDKTTSELPRLFPQVVHLRESGDLWWTGATNAGIRYALRNGARQVMLLNNDCEISRSSIAALTAHSLTTQGVIAPVQESLEGAILFAGAKDLVALGFPTLYVSRAVSKTMTGVFKTPLIMGGRGALIPRSVFDTVGLFDEQTLPHYLSDHDFYLRCRKAGVPLWVATDATARVDQTRTTISSNLSRMSWSAFRDSLSSPKSHRNLAALAAFFRRNYPVPRFWWVGVGLNLARYFVWWTVSRSLALVRRHTDP